MSIGGEPGMGQQPDYLRDVREAQIAQFDNLRNFIAQETAWFNVVQKVSESSLKHRVEQKMLLQEQANSLMDLANNRVKELKKIDEQNIEANAFLSQIPLDADRPFAHEDEMKKLAERAATAFKEGKINRDGLELIVRGLQRRKNLQDAKNEENNARPISVEPPQVAQEFTQEAPVGQLDATEQNQSQGLRNRLRNLFT